MSAEEFFEISADTVTVEVTDAKTGETFRRELPIDYYENANFLRLRAEDFSGAVSELVFCSGRGVERMKDMTVIVTAKGGGAGRLFGSITNVEIADALAKQSGIKLDKRKIVLDEPIKSVGVYTVKCKLGYEINAELKIEVKEG